MAGPDYILDVSGLRPAEAKDTPEAAGGAAGTGDGDGVGAAGLRGRPWLAIHWRCCSVYSRVYRDAGGDGYHARCPRCARPLHIAVGEGGTDSRFFEAS